MAALPELYEGKEYYFYDIDPQFGDWHKIIIKYVYKNAFYNSRKQDWVVLFYYTSNQSKLYGFSTWEIEERSFKNNGFQYLMSKEDFEKKGKS